MLFEFCNGSILCEWLMPKYMCVKKLSIKGQYSFNKILN